VGGHFRVRRDAEDDEEVAARNTLKRRLNWARRAFDELILPRVIWSKAGPCNA
jgi:hypothetical protein